MPVEDRYVDGSYLAANPTWDSEDATWKAGKVAEILAANGVSPASVCDVGCGAGAVLAALRRHLPDSRLFGFDISPQVEKFWARHPDITFRVASPFDAAERFDTLLMLDVFEHVRDPFTFLERARPLARHFVFHIPLDLSGLTVARGAPLMEARHKVGHLHFYTKDLAIETLKECGYNIVDARYTKLATLTTHNTWRTRLAALPRAIAYAINKDFGVRLLGGETLIVLAT
jgi:SAM-dependent methyltransferase